MVMAWHPRLAVLLLAAFTASVDPQTSLGLVDKQVSAELLWVLPGNPGSASALVSWPSFDNALEGTGGITEVEAYEVQFGVSGTGVWNSAGDLLTGLPNDPGAESTEPVPKQRIFTLADVGATINDGYFRLALSYEGSSPSALGGRATAGVVTLPIAFDASAVDMKAAIESLDHIKTVQVFQNALGTNGAFEWIILFDNVKYDNVAEDPLPLLTLYTETISAQWTGAGDQVAIQYLRSTPSSPDRHRRICSASCSHEIEGLQTGKSFTFRVRARYSYDIGWSDWSASSESLRIPATRLPQAPSAPELLSTTTSRIIITWHMRRDLQRGNSIFATELFPVISFNAQQQCDDEIGWTTISENVKPGDSSNKDTFPTVVASLERPPGSWCIFRVAAMTENGQGPFSSASVKFSTQKTAPGAVLNLRVLRDPLRVLWDIPGDLGGHAVDSLSYEVDYRAVSSSAWVRLAAELVDIPNCVANVSAASLASYTTYVARVRAIAENQAGLFSQSPQFLTDYAVDQLNVAEAVDDSLPGIKQVVTAASRHEVANNEDPYYIQLTGNGGSGGRASSDLPAESGQNGAVLIFPVTWSGERLAEHSFFFTGAPQTYRVPGEDPQLRNGAQLPFRVVAFDVYAWGGGGAGARSSSGATTNLSNGGGGAFARGVFKATAGDVFDILVGGGGGKDGRGGYNGGGNGGTGDFLGGGGGGASEVRINGRIVLVAAGGGGAGSTDYCCAHGGGGGGLARAESGLAVDTIPFDLTVMDQTSRDEDYAADYSILATGGGGASPEEPGNAGIGGSYQYSLEGKCIVNTQTSLVEVMVDPLAAARWPSTGQRGRGGSGQSGKQAGGGGGGGRFGGGGGGAGAEGAGGGGGSSFVSSTDLFNYLLAGSSDASLRPTPIGESITQLEVSPVTSSSVSVTWQPPIYGFSQLVEGFVVEMANRSINEDFRVVRLVTLPSADINQNSGNLTVSGLNPSGTYRFRVKPLLYDGLGTYSSVVTLQMPPKPGNTWSRCIARYLNGESTRAGLRFTAAPPLRRSPSARRGHSLTPLDNFLYLFGGMAKSYECNRAQKVPCLLQDQPTALSNELWRYDLLTETWWEVPQVSTPPTAREKHSMAVISKRLLLFGGRKEDTPDPNDASTWGPQAYNDLWELSVSSTTSKTISTNLNTRQPTSITIPDGGEVFALGKKTDVTTGEQLCVASLAVNVQITHACPHKLRIQLFGPGPATFPGRQQDIHSPVDSQARETTWSVTQGLGSFQGDHRATGTAPSTRAFPVLLQSPEQAPDMMPCTAATQTLTFVSVPGAAGTSGATLNPLEPLLVFHQLPSAGNWTLELADTAADGLVGSLNTWDISFELAPCIPAFTWTDLSTIVTGTPPPPRYQHSAVVYQSSMFVYGGTRGGTGLELHDMYRLDYTPSSGFGVSPIASWTQLASLADTDSPSVAERRAYAGRIALLTPYKLMALGRGLLAPRRNSLNSGEGPSAARFESQFTVRLRDLEDPIDGWQRLSVDPADGSEGVDELFPVPRYWEATAFVITPARNSPPRVFLFGGQDDTALLNDFWKLELAQLDEVSPSQQLKAERVRVCAWRQEDATYQAQWTSSCGAISTASATNECTLEMLLLYAWCDEKYQPVLI